MFVGVGAGFGSPAECLVQCRDTVDCQYFTYYERDGVCFSFINCKNFTSALCQDCISGDVECSDVECNLAGELNYLLITLLNDYQ